MSTGTELTELAIGIQRVALQGLQSGQELGFQEGMLHAAAMCEAKAKLHAGYLLPGFQHKDGDHDQASTCGRRDECTNLAYEIRAEAASKSQAKRKEAA